MIAQNPDAYPSGMGQAAAGRIMERLAMGISLLDNPDELAARVEAISSETHFNPQLYAVRPTSLSEAFVQLNVRYIAYIARK